jgi:hypothetical protein
VQTQPIDRHEADLTGLGLVHKVVAQFRRGIAGRVVLHNRSPAAALGHFATERVQKRPIIVRPGNVAVSRESSPGLAAKRGLAALLLLVTLAPATAVAQPTPQPVFTELFAYDPAAPSQLLGKWLISSQLDRKLQPLRVGVVEDPSGKAVGRVTVHEGDGLDDVSEVMLQARRYVCDSEGSRAAEVEAEPGGVVPSERVEIQLRSDRALPQSLAELAEQVRRAKSLQLQNEPPDKMVR